MKLHIKKYRLHKKLTLKEMAEYTGYSKNYLSELENNLKNPTLKVIEEIAVALQVCPKKLVVSCKFNSNCNLCKLKRLQCIE